MSKYRQLCIGFCLIYLTIILWQGAVFPQYLQSQSEEIFAVAEQAYEEELYLKAYQELSRLKKAPYKTNSSARYLLARVCLEMDKEAEARNILQSAASEGRITDPERKLLAEILVDSQYVVEAIDLLRGSEEKELQEIRRKLEGGFCEIFSGFSEALPGDRYIAVRMGELWGYINQEGRWQISPQFSQATAFFGDRALVRIDDKAFFINENGDKLTLFSEKVDNVFPYIKDMAAVKSRGEFFLVDKEWQILSKNFNYVSLPEQGYYFGFDKSWSLYRSSGKCVQEDIGTPILNTRLQGSVQGVFFTKRGDDYVLMDVKKNVLGGDYYTDAKAFEENEGYAAVRNQEGLWGFIDSYGKERIPFRWESALSFSSNLAAVCKDGLWGYINTEGELVIDYQFTEAEPFYQGVARVKKDGNLLIRLISYCRPTNLFN